MTRQQLVASLGCKNHSWQRTMRFVFGTRAPSGIPLALHETASASTADVPAAYSIGKGAMADYFYAARVGFALGVLTVVLIIIAV